MATAVLSDLHVGAVHKRSVAAEDATLRVLAERLDGVDHVVLLGDVLELREAPLRTVLAAAEPLFRTIGRTAPRVTLVAGNHDHQLATPVIDAHRLDGRGPLALDSSVPPPDGGPTARIAEWLAPAELRIAYPGVWIRDDVFATHGHYLDLHNTVPTLECLAVSAVDRAVGARGDGPLKPDDYEAALAPFYSLAFSLAQASTLRNTLPGGASVAIWRRTGGGTGTPGLTGQLLTKVAIPAAVAALNRARLGPFRPELTGTALRKAGLSAMAESLERLGVSAKHVLFGHTHRSGPWPDDDHSEWELPGGGRLLNTGCWVHDVAFGPRGPYAPGTCVFVDDDGPPRLERLL